MLVLAAIPGACFINIEPANLKCATALCDSESVFPAFASVASTASLLQYQNAGLFAFSSVLVSFRHACDSIHRDIFDSIYIVLQVS